jgi:hypothetical protein
MGSSGGLRMVDGWPKGACRAVLRRSLTQDGVQGLGVGMRHFHHGKRQQFRAKRHHIKQKQSKYTTILLQAHAKRQKQ